MDSSGQGGNITYGRISIQVSPEGISSHKYSHDLVKVTEEEVVINMTFVSTFGSAITFYAVHQTKIESYESDVITKLIPMQPNDERNKTGFATGLSFKPLDFTCTELDLSAMAAGMPSHSNVCSHDLTVICRSARDAFYHPIRWHRPKLLHHAFQIPSA
jgi:hypothetical protein